MELESNLPVILQSQLQIAYLLGVSPFHIKYAQRQYLHCSWWPQKLIACCVLISMLILLVHGIVARVTQLTKLNPKVFFSYGFSVFTLISRCLVLKCFWWDGNLLVRICNLAKDSDSLRISSRKRFRCKTTFAFGCGVTLHIILLSLVMLTAPGTGVGPGHKKVSGVTQSLWEKWVHSGQQLFFHKWLRTWGNVIPLDFISAIIYIIGYLGLRSIGIILGLVIFSTILTLWVETKTFTDRLAESMRIERGMEPSFYTYLGLDNFQDWNRDQMQKYSELKKLAGLVSRAFGTPALTVGMIEYLLYYTMSLEAIVKWTTVTVFSIVGAFMYVGFTLVVALQLAFAADITYRMRIFKKWVLKIGTRSEISRDSMYIIARELNSHPVSVTLGKDWPITYSLLANVIILTEPHFTGLFVTYFIICLDNKLEDKDK